MGDRVKIQLMTSTTEHECQCCQNFSPILYGHWGGEDAYKIIGLLQTRMHNRAADLDYSFARMCQIAMLGADSEGNTGWGVSNASGILQEEDSHGDAGCVVVDISAQIFKCTCTGGYLESLVLNEYLKIESEKN